MSLLLSLIYTPSSLHAWMPPHKHSDYVVIPINLTICKEHLSLYRYSLIARVDLSKGEKP